MSRQVEGPIRLAGAILLLLVAVAAAPLVDDIIGFLSDAPYVRYLPMVVNPAGDASLHDVLTSAWNAL